MDKHIYGASCHAGAAWNRRIDDLPVQDEFLRWYGSHSQLADRYTEVYAGFPEVLESDSWDGMAEQLTDYGFRLIVIDEDRNFVYNNAKHSEEGGKEALFYTPNDAGKIQPTLWRARPCLQPG